MRSHHCQVVDRRGLFALRLIRDAVHHLAMVATGSVARMRSHHCQVVDKRGLFALRLVRDAVHHLAMVATFVHYR